MMHEEREQQVTSQRVIHLTVKSDSFVNFFVQISLMQILIAIVCLILSVKVIVVSITI